MRQVAHSDGLSSYIVDDIGAKTEPCTRAYKVIASPHGSLRHDCVGELLIRHPCIRGILRRSAMEAENECMLRRARRELGMPQTLLPTRGNCEQLTYCPSRRESRPGWCEWVGRLFLEQLECPPRLSWCTDVPTPIHRQVCLTALAALRPLEKRDTVGQSRSLSRFARLHTGS